MLLLSESKKYLEIAQRDTYSQQINSFSLDSSLVRPCQAKRCSAWDTTESIKSRNPTLLCGLPPSWMGLCKGFLVHTDPFVAR